MKLILSITLVAIATTLLLSANYFLEKINLRIHQNDIINQLGLYQIYALFIGLIFMFLSMYLFPQGKKYLKTGDLKRIAEKEKILGINGKSSWLKNGLQLSIFISLATGIYIALGVIYSNSTDHFNWYFIPYIFLFSINNSFVEEIIYRFVLISGLEGVLNKKFIMILSALMFGIPHYFGNPGGAVGVIMSGMLGFILSKASIETEGLSIAWFIHFLQDLIIFTGIFMMSIRG